MTIHKSITVKLDDVVADVELEKKIMKKLNKCRNISGKNFKVIFWHKNLSEGDCKRFVKRNQELLFDLNTEITKSNKSTWLIIDSNDEMKIPWRYKWSGGILSGLDEYVKLVNHISKREIR